MFRFLKILPVQLLLSISIALVLGKVLGIFYVQLFYSISVSMIDILMIFMPIIIFTFMMESVCLLGSKALALLLIIALCIIVSSCLAIIIAYFTGKVFIPFISLDNSLAIATGPQAAMPTLWSTKFSHNIKNEYVLILAITAGMLTKRWENRFAKLIKLNQWLNNKVKYALSKFFIPVIPIYVFGFCLKLSYEGATGMIAYNYGYILLVGTLLSAVYLWILYFIGSNRHLKNTVTNIKAMLPAGVTAFATMSSVAAMPVTLKGVEKLTKNKAFTNLIVPLSANIHMVGDALSITLCSLALLKIFHYPVPDFIDFIPFVFMFSFAKLACVGLPGASVMVILPVLQQQLHFTTEMISLLSAIYMLQDSIFSFVNVMGNGGFALVVGKIIKNIKKSA